MRLVFVFLNIGCFLVCGNAQQAPLGNSGDPLKEHSLAAASAIASGDQKRATTEYKAFLAEALHRAANAEAQIGEFSTAQAHFAQALEFAPGDSALLTDLAALRFDENDLLQAETLLNRALGLNPADTRGQFLLGRVLFNLEKYLAAKPHLETAYANGDRDVWYLLGITHLKLQDLQSAQKLFKTMAGPLGDNASTHFRIGTAYYTGDYPDEAIAEFKKAIAQDPKGLDNHYYLGLAYLGHNPEAGFAKAEPEFRAELELAPNDFRSHYMLGYIALKTNRKNAAEIEITKAEALNPEDRGTLLLAAELYSETERLPEAEKPLRRAIALAQGSSPDYELVRAHYMLGRILQKTGREAEANRELAVSEELRSQFRAASGGALKERVGPNPQSTQGKSARTVSAEERDKAKAFLRSLAAPITEAFNNLGAMAAGRNQCPDCVAYFKGAGEWEPSVEGLDRNLGRAAFLCHQYEDAVAPLSRYLQHHGTDVTARSALALSLFQLGQYQKVIDVLGPISSAIQSDPELSNAYATSQAKVKH